MKTDTPRTDEVATFRPDDDGMTDFVLADFARRLERENARLRELVGRARAMIDVSPEDSPDKWPSTDEINQLVKDCDDILSNVPHHPRQPGNEAGNKSNL